MTHDITAYCKANIFSKIGKQTPLAVRFSTVGGESGSADTARDPRGFAVKFYTEEGNWDLVGNNTPIFFIRSVYYHHEDVKNQSDMYQMLQFAHWLDKFPKEILLLCF